MSQKYRIVYNVATSGGLFLSEEAVIWMWNHGCKLDLLPNREIPQSVLPRHDNLLVGCISCLGQKANGDFELLGGAKQRADLTIAVLDSPFYTIVLDEFAREKVISLEQLTDASGGKMVADVVNATELQQRSAMPDHAKDVLWQFEPDKVWFTSDTHFGHENIIKYCNRPFKNVNEMDEELIRRWNATVPEDGVVFHLGDFASGGSKEINNVIHRLNGVKYLILGNHDLKFIRQGFLNLFEHVSQQMYIRVGGQTIVLNHNPFLAYGGSYKDVWQLFGHVHSGPRSKTGLDNARLKYLFPRQYDVGVDNNDYHPVSFAEVKVKIEAQERRAQEGAGVIGNWKDKVNYVVFLDPAVAPVTPEQKELFARIAVETGAKTVNLIYDEKNESVNQAIARRVLAMGGNTRYVYLGLHTIQDFRYVQVDRKTGITEEIIKTAIKILR